MTSTPIIDYTNRDFASIKQALIDAIADLLPEWTSRSDSDFGIVLIELFSYIGDLTNYYIDRVFNEMFLQTATRQQSVLNIAALLDYSPIAMTPATVSLTFTLIPGTGSVDIPAGTQVSTLPDDGSAPIIFETDIDLVIAGNTVATPQYVGAVTATQGQTIADENLTLNSTGNIDQEYTLFNTNVIQNSVIITVDEGNGPLTWNNVHNLVDSNGPSRVFQTSIDENQVLHVMFGDNVNGRAPSPGAVITATYRTGNGADGDVGANQLVELLDTIVGVQSVTNPQAANGGSDAESIDSMRTSIPQSLFALNRAVALADYKALGVQVPGVGKAQADAAVYTNVSLYIAPVGAGFASSTLKASVLEYFSDKTLVNVGITLLDPQYIGVNVSANVAVLPNYHQDTVKQSVNNALLDLMNFNNVDFGKTITISSVYHTIQGVEGVDYCNLVLLIRADAATQAGVQDVLMNVGEIPIAGTFTLAMTGGIS